MDARRRRRRIAGVAGGVVAVAVIAALAVSFDLRHLDADAIAARVRASGAAGPLALIALLVLQAVVAPLPSPPILIAGGFVYGPWVGFAIGWLGLLLAASACFGLARLVGRTFVERFVDGRRLAEIETAAGRQSGWTLLAVLSLRLFMPPAFDAVSYGCGLVRVPFGVFLLGTALGEVPKVGSFTYIGAAAGGVPGWLTAWVLVVPNVGLIVLGMLRKRWRAARERAGASGPSAA